MTYPKVSVYLDKIKHNTKVLTNMCSAKNIIVAGVTKVFCGEPNITKAIIDGGVSILADSRIENLEKLKEYNLPKLLLRIPMISQANRVVTSADISLNSEIDTIKALSNEALKLSKVHNIILMIDLGDLREGIFNRDEIFKTVNEIIKLKGVRLVGLGTNLTCYGGIIPKEENLNRLVSLKEELEDVYDMTIDIVSGGNSSSIYLLEEGDIPRGINQLRLGESIVLGRETAFGEKIKNTYDDCFKLVVEIIEIKEKPSVPIGEIGMDAFGNKPSFIDKGNLIRAICAVGKQDVDLEDIIPDDKDISILGGSSDHLILDITKSNKTFKVGDKVEFKLSYGGILSTMTSEYIYKEFI